MGDKVLLRRTAFKGKHKIHDCWEDTVYHIQGQPYAGLLVIKITPLTGEGKVKMVHWNLLPPFRSNIKGGPENEGTWQWTTGFHLDSLCW